MSKKPNHHQNPPKSEIATKILGQKAHSSSSHYDDQMAQEQLAQEQLAQEQLAQEQFARLYNVSRETLYSLKMFRSLLVRRQKEMNLVGKSTLPHFWVRHILDSAQIIQYVPKQPRFWVDLGSGAGFPPLVVALLMKEKGVKCVFHLLEKSPKKCHFLQEASHMMGLDVEVHCVRVEDYTEKYVEDYVDKSPFCVISARAFAPLDRLLRLSFPLFSSHTRGLFLKGAGIQDELTKVLPCWNMDYDLHKSKTCSQSFILELKQISPKQS